jgi:preprotein translocase subunit SecD
MVRAPFVALALAGAATAAQAETPLVSILADEDALHAFAGDVQQVQPTFDPAGQPALNIRLDPQLDGRFAGLTAAHVGRPITVLVCGQVASEPMLMGIAPTASVVISGLAMDEVNRLAAVLAEGSCDPKPSS